MALGFGCMRSVLNLSSNIWTKVPAWFNQFRIWMNDIGCGIRQWITIFLLHANHSLKPADETVISVINLSTVSSQWFSDGWYPRHHQTNSSHGTDYAVLTRPCVPQWTISTICTIPISKYNFKKDKRPFVFIKITSGQQGLTSHEITCVIRWFCSNDSACLVSVWC